MGRHPNVLAAVLIHNLLYILCFVTNKCLWLYCFWCRNLAVYIPVQGITAKPSAVGCRTGSEAQWCRVYRLLLLHPDNIETCSVWKATAVHTWKSYVIGAFELKPAPPTTAGLCTTSVNMACCRPAGFCSVFVLDVLFRAALAISLRRLILSRASVARLLSVAGQLWGEWGICFVLVGGCMVVGAQVCLWPGVCREARVCGFTAGFNSKPPSVPRFRHTATVFDITATVGTHANKGRLLPPTIRYSKHAVVGGPRCTVTYDGLLPLCCLKRPY